MSPIEDESEVGQQMRLSREIIVLDFGDEANSPYDEKEKTVDQQEEESRSRNGEADDDVCCCRCCYCYCN